MTAIFFSCVSVEEKLSESWNNKITAINTSDSDLYMSTLSTEDSYYRNESYAWFWYMANNDFQNLSFNITGIDQIDQRTVLVHINQKHIYAGENFDFNYNIVYSYQDGKWLDCDLDFLRHDVDGFRIFYRENERNLQSFERYLINSNEALSDLFGTGVDENFPVKLYTDRELLRQRTYPIIERQFTAWGEANESLKIWTGHPTIPPYEGTIRHELVHHITLKISRNYLAGWYAEGLAVHYGNGAVFGGDFIKSGRLSPSDAAWNIAKLESIDMASMTDEKEISCFYGISALIVKYMAETWGDDVHRKILEACAGKDFFDRAKSEDSESILQPVLHSAFEQVTGRTSEELSDGYLSWLKKTY